MASTAPHSGDPFEIKAWWDSVVREEKTYPAFAFFLTMPSNDSFREYAAKNGKEIAALAGNDCFTLIIGKEEIRRIGVERKLTSKEALQVENKKINAAYFGGLRADPVEEGYSVRLADLLKIPVAELPCFVIFPGIFAQEHLLIKLPGNREELQARVREIYAAVHQAAAEKRPVLSELGGLRKKELFLQDGKELISAPRNVAAKTYQTAIEVWIKSLLGGKAAAPRPIRRGGR